jgi:3-hydroxyisobutyrate dehydrogenase-like beta-hydroxyacid dehydrogenase
MRMSVVGLVHPGEMGAAVGRCLRQAGHTVLWAAEGRSASTADRAAAAGLTDAGTISVLVAKSDVVLSICPPHAALATAEEFAGFDGIFVDANAVAPDTVRAVGAAVGGPLVDGGIIGYPPDGSGGTRLYLAGPHAATVADLFTGSDLDARVLPDAEIGAASALKITYAAWTKGIQALLLGVRELARAEGVEDALLAEWALSQPDLPGRSLRAAAAADAKGWRWIGEMEEIASTFAARELPPGFHLAAAEIYRRWPHP